MSAVDVEFGRAKDAATTAKHGVSLSAALRLDVRATVHDRRVDYAEDRFNAYGLIEGVTYCLAFIVRRGKVRAISRRRARHKEYRRHVL